MNWKNSLDKYLTNPPDDGFDNWCEDIISNQFTDLFYNGNEDWVHKYNGLCDKWLNELFRRGKNTSDSAKIIERAFKIYTKTK